MSNNPVHCPGSRANFWVEKTPHFSMHAEGYSNTAVRTVTSAWTVDHAISLLTLDWNILQSMSSQTLKALRIAIHPPFEILVTLPYSLLKRFNMLKVTQTGSFRVNMQIMSPTWHLEYVLQWRHKLVPYNRSPWTIHRFKSWSLLCTFEMFQRNHISTILP